MQKRDTEWFVGLALSVHDGKYSYDKSNYINNKTPVVITCRVHGEFTQRPDNHLQGQGCPRCASSVRNKGKNIEKKSIEFINKSTSIHEGFYQYDLVEYKNARTKVKIKCPLHGVFEQSPDNHSHGYGCPRCGDRKTAQKQSLTAEIFGKRANVIHGQFYNYSYVSYVNDYTRVQIDCPHHGIFEQTPRHHLNGNGCPKCKSSSVAEIRLMRILDDNNIAYVFQKTFDDCRNPSTGYPLRFDFYLPSIHTVIEYDGAQHFRPVGHWGGEKSLRDTQYRDDVKTKYCANNGIELIRILYPHKHKFYQILVERGIIV